MASCLICQNFLAQIMALKQLRYSIYYIYYIFYIQLLLTFPNINMKLCPKAWILFKFFLELQIYLRQDSHKQITQGYLVSCYYKLFTSETHLHQINKGRHGTDSWPTPIVFRYLSYSTTLAEHAIHRLLQCPAFGRARTCLFLSVH